MRMRRHAQEDEDESETGIDLAPMLDFVLNLLIFFIITAVFVKEIGLPLSRPPAASSEPSKAEESQVLFIAVHRSGDISIDRRLVDKGAVRANVERFRAEKPDGPVIVVANRDAPAGVVVGVMDQARLGGALNVSMQPSNSVN